MCSELGDAEDAVLRLGPGSFDVCLHGILAKLPPAFSCAGKTLFFTLKVSLVVGRVIWNQILGTFEKMSKNHGPWRWGGWE